MCQIYVWHQLTRVCLPGSNQSGNNLTLKGWPLTVSHMTLLLCSAVYETISRVFGLSLFYPII